MTRVVIMGIGDVSSIEIRLDVARSPREGRSGNGVDPSPRDGFAPDAVSAAFQLPVSWWPIRSRTLLKNSFGFGGASPAVVLRALA